MADTGLTLSEDLLQVEERHGKSLIIPTWEDRASDKSTFAVAGSDVGNNEDLEDCDVSEDDSPNASIISNAGTSISTQHGNSLADFSSERVTSPSQLQKSHIIDIPPVKPRDTDGTESSPPTDTEPLGKDGDSGSETDLEDNTENDYDDGFDEDGNGTWVDQFRLRNRNLNAPLPDTVTRLETIQGGIVYLVGTAHFSLESQEDVAKTIQATQPDVVLVELCKGRAIILQLDEQTILEEAKNMNLEKIRSTIKQNGFVQGIMYLFLLNMSAHLTKQLGTAPGGEFRRAFAEAMQVPGCSVRLGDRPIQITLQRALAELTLWQKLCLAWYMLTSKEPISKEEVERCKQRDLLEEMLAEMTGKFPALSRVFVKERDIFLTHSLQLAATALPHNFQNIEGHIPTVVVGVVGIGHVPGIVEHWGRVTTEDIPPLLEIPKSSRSSQLFKYTMKASVCSLVLFGCYKVMASSKVLNLVSKLTRGVFK